MNKTMSVRTKRIFVGTITVILCIVYLYANKSSYASNDDGKIVSMKSLLAGAIRAAEVGGFEIIGVHDQLKFNVESKGKTKEGVNDPVTTADYRSHCVMYHSLINTFPGITVISEEKSKGCDQVQLSDLKSFLHNLDEYNLKDDVMINANDITVWIDPLDATKEFTENLLQYVTTMVCVVVKGIPVIGIIYKPFEKKRNSMLYWTWTDHGTSANLKDLIKFEGERSPVLIVSRSHAGQIHNTSKMAFGDDVQIISAAGAGYKFLEVAIGNATAYVHTTAIKKWDICAGTAILRENLRGINKSRFVSRTNTNNNTDYRDLGGTVTSLFGHDPLTFGPTDSKVLNLGLLATMKDHKWYMDKLTNF